MAAVQAMPQRSAGSPLQSGLPRPPGKMPLIRDRRPLKAWTYAGLFSEELMLCAASVRIGPFPTREVAEKRRDELTAIGFSGNVVPR